jgi:hypothetical protein
VQTPVAENSAVDARKTLQRQPSTDAGGQVLRETVNGLRGTTEGGNLEVISSLNCEGRSVSTKGGCDVRVRDGFLNCSLQRNPPRCTDLMMI